MNNAQGSYQVLGVLAGKDVGLIVQIMDALPTAIYATDVQGRIIAYNKAASDLWDNHPKLGEDQWCGSWRLYWPDGRPMRHDECPMAITLRERRDMRGAEAMAGRPDGVRIPFLAYPSLLRDDNGIVIGAVNMLVDITERKRAELQKEVMVAELNHRVKNILASVQAITSMTFRSSESLEQVDAALRSRFVALAGAHDLLTNVNWEGTDLATVVNTTLAPMLDRPDRIHIEGPAVFFPSSMAVIFHMAVHELCTNALKYGALSDEKGRVVITWHVAGECPDRRLLFQWVERGGPKVSIPARKGFGSRLIEQALAMEINGEVKIYYNPTGVECVFDAPLPASVAHTVL